MTQIINFKDIREEDISKTVKNIIKYLTSVGFRVDDGNPNYLSLLYDEEEHMIFSLREGQTVVGISLLEGIELHACRRTSYVEDEEFLKTPDITVSVIPEVLGIPAEISYR